MEEEKFMNGFKVRKNENKNRRARLVYNPKKAKKVFNRYYEENEVDQDNPMNKFAASLAEDLKEKRKIHKRIINSI